jgi:chaperonin GroES
MSKEVSAMELKPFDDRVVIEKEEEGEEEVTLGGIIVPDTAKEEKARIGKVIAVGTDPDLQEHIKVGDKIIYGKFVGDEIEMEGKKYIIVQRPDILAIVVD